MSNLAKTLNMNAVSKTSNKKDINAIVPIGQREDEIGDDYNYTRNNLYETIEIGREAIAEMQQIAADTGEPRAYEVLAKLLGTHASAIKELLESQKRMSDVESYVNRKGADHSKNVNIFFNGTTQELRELIKKSTP